MADVSLKSVFNRPPEAAQAYLQSKGYAITDSWRDLSPAAHARAFTVARAAKLEVLQSIREELQRAQAEGLPFQAFKKNLQPRLQALGWWGKAVDKESGEITPYPGTSRPIELGTPRRLETIYRTNLQTAYMAGRWKRFEAESKRAPYLQYIAVMDGRTRPSHAALNLRVFRFDDPIWDHIYPPNGFNCRCRVRNLSQRELDTRQLKLSSSAGYMKTIQQEQKSGAVIERSTIRLPSMDRVFSPDIGWDYNPGRAASRWDKFALLPDCGGSVSFAEGDKCIASLASQKTWRDYGRPDLRDVPDARRIVMPQMIEQVDTQDAAVAILAGALGVSQDNPVRLVKTPIEQVALHYDYLPHMVEKRIDGRERYANFILPTLQDPFEVYLTQYDDGMRHRYIGLFTGRSDLMVVVRQNIDGSLVWNIMQANDKAMNKQRQGALLYGK